jgi:hypothetical protein
VKLLDELPRGTATFAGLRKRPPRLPFYLVENVDEASAAELVARLGELGLVARVERRASIGVRDVRRKVRTMTVRYAVLPAGALNFFTQMGARLPLPVFCAALGTVLLAPLVAVLIRYRRPLVALAGGANEHAAMVSLAEWLPRISRREDRRVLARVIDRLQLGSELGCAEAAGLLAERGALICEGLAALSDGNRHLDEAELERAVAAGRAGDDISAALNRLREAERLRGVLVTDLLRIFSRADRLCIRLARIGSLAAGEQAVALARELDDLKLELEAEEDVVALLV